MNSITLGIELVLQIVIASYWNGDKIIFIKNIDNSFIFPSNIMFSNGNIISTTHNLIKLEI